MTIKSMLTLKNAGYALLGYSGLALGVAQLGMLKEPVDGNWYTKLIMTAVGGVACLYLNKFNISDWFKGGDSQVGVVHLDSTIETKNIGKFAVGALAMEDFESLSYLADRLLQAKDLEGVKMCKELNAHLFDVHHVAPKVETIKE